MLRLIRICGYLFRSPSSRANVPIALRVLLAFSLLALSSQVFADSNMQFVRGSGFELGPEERGIITFESLHKYDRGDIFAFVDVSEPFSEGSTLVYAELAGRHQLAELKASALPFDNLYATYGLERASGVRGYLVGLGVKLNVKGFTYVNLNAYLRKTRREFVDVQSGVGGQINLSWHRPFSLGSTKWVFLGHVDFAFSENKGSDPKKNNINAAPKLLLDVGDLIGIDQKLFAGVELQLWRNKFGISGIHEHVPQAMIKWNF